MTLLTKLLKHPCCVAGLGFFWLVVAASDQPLVADEARWMYVVREWLTYAAPPYTQVIENKTPGIFYVMGLGTELFGPQHWFPRLLGMLLMVGTSLLLYRIGKMWKSHTAGLLALAVFLFPCAWRSFDGSVAAYTESFMTFFSTFAFFWILHVPREKLLRLSPWVISGIFLGCAIAFKQIAVLTLIGFIFFVLFELAQKGFRARALFGILTGVVFATGLSGIPLWMSGVSVLDYIRGAWLILLNPGDFGLYPGTSATGAVRLSYFAYILKRPDTIAMLLCGLFVWQNRNELQRRHIPAIGLLAWMVFDTLGVHASGYYLAHQFKQALPSLALGVAIVLSELVDALPRRDPSGNEKSQLVMAWVVILMMMGTSEISASKRVWKHLKNPPITPEQRLGSWINTNTQPTDFIYGVEVFSDVVQYYSGRRSSSKYFNTHFITPDVVPEVIQDVTLRRPARLIVLWENKAPSWLWTIVKQSFVHRFTYESYWVYELKSTPPVTNGRGPAA